MVSVNQNAHHHRPLLVQAPVRALDPDGLTVLSLGTLGFAVGIGFCLYYLPLLQAADKEWYLWVAISGFVLGLGGLAFTFNRHRQRKQGSQPRRAAAPAPAPPTTLADPDSVEQSQIDVGGVPDRE